VFQDEFNRRVIKKFSYEFDGIVSNVEFLHTKKYMIKRTVGFYLILFQVGSNIQIMDIEGNICGNYNTTTIYQKFAGNPHNDDYYFVGLSQQNHITRFNFTVK